MICVSGATRLSSQGLPKGRLLYLTNQSPYPPQSGGQLREWQFLSRLGSRYEVHLVIVTPHPHRDVGHVQQLLGCCRTVTFFAADPDAAGPGLPDRVGQFACPEVGPYLVDFVRRHPVDFVHVEGYFLIQHVPAELGIPIFLAEENIEYQLDRAKQQIEGCAGAPWTVTRALEQRAWGRATRCGAVTPEDVATIQAYLPAAPVHWLPPGCDHFSADDPGGTGLAPLPAGKRVVYTGNASWSPSRDATRYLLAEVWPRALAEVPDAHLVIAGSGQTAGELGLATVDRSVHLCGVLPSLGPLLRSADVFVCPVRFGGGIKSKILESLHAGCAVVGTPVGLQGLPPAGRQAVLVGTTAAELAEKIVALLRDDGLRNDLRARAVRAAADLTTWVEAARWLDAAWSAVLTDPGPARLLAARSSLDSVPVDPYGPVELRHLLEYPTGGH